MYASLAEQSKLNLPELTQRGIEIQEEARRVYYGAENYMSETIEIPTKPPVGGMSVCQRCGHYQWEHNVDIVVDGKVVRPETKERQGGVCLHNGTIRCCNAFCREFQAGA